MKCIVAVSGGVDSVVLLDMLAKKYPQEQLIVAHFEHGIRGEASQNDALFVENLSQKYRLKYEIGYGNLTKHVSEDEARQKRYDFLKQIVAKYDGQLVTAHHQDDLVETIAINLTRGTGWRGLAVFGDSSIHRPLLGMRKEDIYAYALKYSLEWVEDETNLADVYLRNRLRRKINVVLTAHQREKLVELYRAQTRIRESIDKETEGVTTEQSESRYFFTMIPEKVAIELLRRITEGRLHRPQLVRVLLAVKTYRAGSVYQAGMGIEFEFSARRFVVTNTSRVL